MKRGRKIKFIAVLLTMLMFLTALPSPVATATTTEEIPEFVEGEVIYQPELTGEGNGVPEGWRAVPETQVPWLNDGASGGWAEYDAENTENGMIDISNFTYTDSGLAVSLGAGDFGVIFPELRDKLGKPVVDYMYTMKVSGVNAKNGGSFGPITDVAGNLDYAGGSHLMVYDDGYPEQSYRYYVFANRTRYTDNTVMRTDENAIPCTEDGSMTITVYHSKEVNYYYANGSYLFSQIGLDCYDGAEQNGVGIAFCNTKGLVIEEIIVKQIKEKELANVPDFAEGEVIYHPELTGEGNGVPQGWLAVPEKQVPWLNDGASGGWANYDASNTKNGEINTSAFTYTENGLAVTLGAGDFGIVFPELKDSTDAPVTDYMYTIKLSGTNVKNAGSFGPITDIAGGADYVGGTHLMIYDDGYTEQSYRRYVFSNRQRYYDNTVLRSAKNAIDYTDDGTMTVTVYHCNDTNYYFVNGSYLFTQDGMDNYEGAVLNGIGMAFCNAKGIVIEDIVVKKIVAKGVNKALTLPGASIRYCDVDGSVDSAKSDGLRFAASIDKTSELYKSLVPEGIYDTSNENVKFGMVILPTDLIPTHGILTVDTPLVVDTVMTKITNQDEQSLDFMVSLLDIPRNMQGRSYTARMYVKSQAGDAWEYTYSIENITRTYVGVANQFYEETEDEAIRMRLNRIFSNCAEYEGENAKRLTFAVFSDFHYKKGTYMSSVADMEAILGRANEANASFIIHAGDFCNDYSGSPELFHSYLDNNYQLPALGIYGNHELESIGNSMQVVTPLLNNDIANKNVVWGTEDGKLGDGSIAYYYYEVNGFRIVCLDTNYSYNEATGEWVHNATATSSPSTANKYWHSLGPVQLQWLETTLMDAAEKDIPCVVFSHVNFAGVWPYQASGDAKAVREIFAEANAKQAGTVLMAVSGHIHTNHADIVDNVLYLDVNTVRNGVWQEEKQDIYTDETFEYIEYDSEGNPISTTDMKLDDLYYGKNTWFFKDPLSAIIHISSAGRIVIEGSETEWMSDVVPNSGFGDGMEPEVSSGTYSIPLY